MPSLETRTPDTERWAQMVAPLRDAFPLLPTDARFAELLGGLRDTAQPAGRGPDKPRSCPHSA